MTAPTGGLVVLPADELRDLVREAVAEALAENHAARTPEPDLVSPSEMARRLGVSRTTLHRLRKNGAPAVRVGDVFKYKPAAVLAWIESEQL